MKGEVKHFSHIERGEARRGGILASTFFRVYETILLLGYFKHFHFLTFRDQNFLMHCEGGGRLFRGHQGGGGLLLTFFFFRILRGQMNDTVIRSHLNYV